MKTESCLLDLATSGSLVNLTRVMVVEEWDKNLIGVGSRMKSQASECEKIVANETKD